MSTDVHSTMGSLPRRLRPHREVGQACHCARATPVETLRRDTTVSVTAYDTSRAGYRAASVTSYVSADRYVTVEGDSRCHSD